MELDGFLEEGYIIKAARVLNELKFYIDSLAGKIRSESTQSISIGFPPSISITFPFLKKKKRHLAFIRKLLEDTPITDVEKKIVRLHSDAFVVDIPHDIDPEELTQEEIDRYDGRWDEYPQGKRSNGEDDEDVDDLPFWSWIEKRQFRIQ